MSTLLEIKALTKSFSKKGEKVINGIDLTIKRGSVVSFLGESGSGKTTLARLIAGLEVPDSGEIQLSSTIVANDTKFIPPQERHIGMVFQDYALFPHMTVFQNVAYGIQNRSEKETRVNEVLKLVGLTEFTDRYPHQLSGGQQQRVALARALAPKPHLLLLDEPFSNLDASLKRNLRSELFEIIRESKVTAIFLTHDTQDAMAVSDTIVVLKDGQVIQQGTAETLYENPNSYYIASLFGPVVKLNHEDLAHFSFDPQATKTYSVRQDAFQINNKKLMHNLEAEITQSTFLGNQYLNHALLPNKSIVRFNSQEQLNGKIILGLEEDSLLSFKA